MSCCGYDNAIMGNLINSGSGYNNVSVLGSDDDVVLYYQDWGRGKPIVLVHGWPLNLEMWEYQARELADQGFRVIAYDRRGFGRSTKVFYGYHYEQFASDLNDLLTRLDLRDVILVGFSEGSGEIARYLTRYGSARIEKTILISATIPYLCADSTNPDGIEKRIFDEMLLSLKDDRPRFLHNFLKEFYGVGLLSSPVSEGILEWTFEMAMQACPKAVVESVNAFSKTDFRPDLSSFTMPTLLIHGDADKIIPYENTTMVAGNAIVGSTIKIYAGAPHGLFVTNKEELLEDIILFATSQQHLEHAAKRMASALGAGVARPTVDNTQRYSPLL